MKQLGEIIGEVTEEVIRASAKFERFNSAHEAAAVIREEFDEFWDEVKNNKITSDRTYDMWYSGAKAELVQIAAVSIRAIYDLKYRR